MTPISNKVFSVSEALQPASDAATDVHDALCDVYDMLPQSKQFAEARELLAEQIDKLEDIYNVVMGVQIKTLD